MNSKTSVEDIAFRVQVLLFVVVVLVGLLFGFVVVKCMLLTVTLCKSKKKGTDKKLDSVVVKGKEEKPSRASSKLAVKPKRSSKKKSSRASSTVSKTSKSSAAELSSKNKKSSKKDVKQKSKILSAESAKKSAVAQLKTASNVSSKVDSTSSGTNTLTLITRIPPQFPSQKIGKKRSDLDTTTGSQIENLPPQFGREQDTSTDQQIAEIPPQFENPKTARGTTDVHLNAKQVHEIAAQVLSYLALAQPNSQLATARTDDLKPPQSLPQAPVQQPLSQAPVPQVFSHAPVPQFYSKAPPQSAAQPKFPTFVYANGVGESTYLIDVGRNGETVNANPPINEVAANSLIINEQNASSDPAKNDNKTAK